MKIYTYFEEVFEKQKHIENLNLLELWQKHWSNYGYTPVVLNRSHAIRDPKYNLYLEKFQSFPTINPQKYELSCFLRWIAMSNIGGCMSDFDVFPNTNNLDYDCERLEKKILHYNKNNNLSIWSGGVCPCLISGSALAYQKILDLFFEIDLEDYFSVQEAAGRDYGQSVGLKHVSDQQIIDYHWILKELNRMEFYDFYEKDIIRLCAESNMEWEQMPTIHFSSGAVGPDGTREKKCKAVERILGCQF